MSGDKSQKEYLALTPRLYHQPPSGPSWSREEGQGALQGMDKLFAFLSASGSRSITSLVLAWGFLKHIGIITQTSNSRCFDRSQETSPST